VRVGSWIFVVACLALLGTAVSASQTVDDRIITDHVRLRIPLERQSLGQDVVSELERCWKFMALATDNSLPRQVLVNIGWDDSAIGADFKTGALSIGMRDPAAERNPQAFIVHNAARQLARLGLNYLSRGRAFREDTQFLAEGMAEILVREYERTARSLGSAWTVARFLDEMGLLGLQAQSSWTAFSGGRHSMRATAPGVTFLTTCREMHGRDKLPKLFETLSEGSLEQSLAAVFKTSAASLEAAWLQRVRSYADTDDIIVTSAEDAPQLQQITVEPTTALPGQTLQFRLQIKDGDRNLSPDGVFLRDESNGRIAGALPMQEKGVSYFGIEVMVETERRPGDYGYTAVAIDDSGNVCHWKGRYKISNK
jgi:hypothetical protein